MSHSEPHAGGAEASEEELRAAYEAEIKRIRVESLVLEQVVTLVNMGMRRTGLAPGTEDERDPGQVRIAIEAVRALLPLLEQTAPQQATQIRDALSQLQLAFVRIGGRAPEPGQTGEGAGDAGGAAGGPSGAAGGGGGAAPGPPEDQPGGGQGEPGPGPAQRSGRLWVPGQ